MGSREGEAVADFQFDAFVGELGNADFRALQVTEQGNVAAMLGGRIAHQTGTSLVFFGRAVGKVQTGYIQAGQDQLLENFRRIAGRAKGGDDFGTTDGHALTPLLNRSRGYSSISL
ncbi:hypothetical protein D3C84_186040 [compost metagenome]